MNTQVITLYSVVRLVFIPMSNLYNRLMAFLPPSERISQVIAGTKGNKSRDSILVVDVSPSMLEKDYPPCRLEAAKHASYVFIRRLFDEDPEARVAIIAYGGTARVMCPLTPVISLLSAPDIFERMPIVPGTNITAGLQKALKLLSDRDRTCQVVLLTDGQHNTGPLPTAAAKEIRKFAVLDCVGIGSTEEVDEDLLKKIATVNSDGSVHYRWIGDAEQFKKHFHDLGGCISRD